MKKFWIWSVSIFFVIALFFTLAFTVFSLNGVRMNFHNATTKFLSTETQNQIIETAKFNYNSSVLFQDKQSRTMLLEKTYPYLKVINIETTFPSSLVIHAVEREALFVTKFTNGCYVFDKDLKVLEINSESIYESTQNNNILLEVGVPSTLSPGDFATISESRLIKQISPAFELINRDLCEQKALIKKIKIVNTVDVLNPNSLTNLGLEILDFSGLKTVISVGEKRLVDKLNFFCAIQTLSIDKSSQYFYIFENSDGKIEAIKKALD